MALDVLEEQNIKDLTKYLANSPANGGHVTFGISRTKRLIGHGYINLTLTVTIGVTQEEVSLLWSEALERVNAKKSVVKQFKDTQADAKR